MGQGGTGVVAVVAGAGEDEEGVAGFGQGRQAAGEFASDSLNDSRGGFPGGPRGVFPLAHLFDGKNRQRHDGSLALMFGVKRVKSGMLSNDEIRGWVRAALAEDVGSGDVTTLATVPAEARISVTMVARERLVLAGVELAEAAFLEMWPGAKIERVASDGERVPKGGALLRLVEAPARGVLTAERVALNFVQRLSGVATLTSRYVEAVAHTPARILDTRKTTTGWRRLEKYAVVCGGGMNYRIGLFDQVLIKDNHLAALRGEKPSAVAAAVTRARAAFPKLLVEVEADTLGQAEEAARAGVDIILLDNMSLEELREAVRQIGGRAKTEASGGVNLATVGAIAETGVDFISVGALTHSAPAVDIALDFAGDLA